MFRCKEILVVVETSDINSTALKRAVWLTRHTNAHLTILYIAYSALIAMQSHFRQRYAQSEKQALIKKDFEWLNRLVSSFRFNDLDIETKIKWGSSANTIIAEQVAHNNYDLVIKRAGSNKNSFVDSFFSTDMDLLRHCACPVMLVAEDRKHRGGVLCAVDTETSVASNQSFNEELTKQACQISEYFGTQTHLVNSYFDDLENMYINIPDTSEPPIEHVAQRQHQQDLENLAKLHAITTANQHLEQGHPDHVIPKVADRTDVSLLVMGIKTRIGLNEFLFGHTAEHILDSIHCDVLAIPPNAFTGNLESTQ